MFDQTAYNHRISETARRRVQDATIREARLLAQKNDATAYRELVEREYYEVRHPLTLQDVTPKERHDLLTALHVALDILDTGEDG